MKKAIFSKIFLFLIFSFLIATFVSAEITDYCEINDNNSCVVHSENYTKTDFTFLNSLDTDKITIIFFYSSKCENCREADIFVNEMEYRYGNDINVLRFDVSYPKNLTFFENFCTRTDISEKRIPVVAVGKNIYTGTGAIKENLAKDINASLVSGERIHPLKYDNCTANAEETKSSDSILKTLGIDSLKTASIIPVIIFSGLGDGINPCAFSILILLMSVLQQMSDNKKRLKKIIGTYVVVVFLVNVLLGIIYFYTAVQLSAKLGVGMVFRYLVATIAIFAGIVNLKDFFFYGQGFSLKIPESAQGFIHNLVNKGSIISSAILGGAVALLEAPCSIPIYLTVLEILRNQGWGILQAMPLILLYNLMFIVPLVILALVIYYGKEAKALEGWRQENRNIMRLIMGLIMLVLATGLIVGWF